MPTNMTTTDTVPLGDVSNTMSNIATPVVKVRDAPPQALAALPPLPKAVPTVGRCPLTHSCVSLRAQGQQSPGLYPTPATAVGQPVDQRDFNICSNQMPVDSFEQQQLSRQLIHEVNLLNTRVHAMQGDVNILRQIGHENNENTAMIKSLATDTKSIVTNNGQVAKKNLEISTKNFEVTTEIRGLAGHTQESLMRYFSSRGADLEAMEVQRAEMVARYARSVGTDRIAPCASLPPLTEICLALVSAGSMRRWT